MHCIYNLGLGVVAQGDKQVLLGDESIDYGPGQSMLTTIDLPVVSHVRRATRAEPFLGMMLTLDVRSIVQMASEMDETRQRREDGSRSISFEVLDADLLDALVRLVKLLGQPALVPGLAPLIQREVILRLLTGPHGPQLRRLVTAGSPSQQIAKAVAWLKQNFVQALDGDELARSRAHEPLDLPAAFPRPYRREPAAVPEAIASAGSTAIDAEREPRRRQRRRACGYESPSQFSREYSRLFGAPPQRDVTRMRLAPVASAGNPRRTLARSAARETGPRHRSTRPSLVPR